MLKSFSDQRTTSQLAIHNQWFQSSVPPRLTPWLAPACGRQAAGCSEAAGLAQGHYVQFPHPSFCQGRQTRTVSVLRQSALRKRDIMCSCAGPAAEVSGPAVGGNRGVSPSSTFGAALSFSQTPSRQVGTSQHLQPPAPGRLVIWTVDLRCLPS